MLIAITGTPGTGKNSTCRILSQKGYKVVDLNELAEEKGLVAGFDRKRDTRIVDIGQLSASIIDNGSVTFLQSHFSHFLKVDLIIVLRCNPKILRKRLESRSWKERKVRENVEAEVLDVITIESLQRNKKVYEIDTSERTPQETAEAVLQILEGRKGYEAGKIDWSEEVLSWY